MAPDVYLVGRSLVVAELKESLHGWRRAVALSGHQVQLNKKIVSLNMPHPSASELL